MPGLDKLLRGVLKYRATLRPKMVKDFQRIRDNPEVMYSGHALQLPNDSARFLSTGTYNCLALRSRRRVDPRPRLV